MTVTLENAVYVRAALIATYTAQTVYGRHVFPPSTPVSLLFSVSCLLPSFSHRSPPLPHTYSYHHPISPLFSVSCPLFLIAPLLSHTYSCDPLTRT